MSCRGGGGSGGGLLGTETRDAVAAEKSLITHSAGGGTPPRARTPETQGSSSLRGPLPAAPPPLPRARARAPAACENTADTPNLRAPRTLPHPHSGRNSQADPDSLPRPKFPTPTTPRRRRLREPSAISVRTLSARQGPKPRRLLLCRTRLYVCGAGAHAQTPSSLLPFCLPPPPATATASSCRRSPLLLLRSGAGPSSPDAARDWGIRWSRRRALVTTITAPSPPARRPPSAPTHSPAPFADTDQPHLSFL